MKLALLFATLSVLLLSTGAVRVYTVLTQKLSDSPIISNSSGSAWKYNYNAAAYSDGQNVNLLVRCQDLKNASEPFAVGPSFISPAQVTFDNSGVPHSTQAQDVSFIADPVTEKCGTEDPRISYKDGLYYLMYTAYDCTYPKLSLATSPNPFDAGSWTRHGFVFPDKDISKSGAVLFATRENNLTQHYLFWGDSSAPVGGIGIATSKDGINWQDSGNYLIKVRQNFFDSELVESGPSPLLLSTGDFLFIYNSARRGYPSVKPDWQLQYNVGFLILDGTDPTKIIERSPLPIMSPTLNWEIGNTTDYLTPNVVFLEGLVPEVGGCPNSVAELEGVSANRECFFGVYGGSDSDVGAVRVIVNWVEAHEETEQIII